MSGPVLPDLRDVGAFLRSVDVEFDETTGQRVTGHAELTTEHHTPWGVVHGGVYTTIIESAASVGASIAAMEHRQVAVGVNNNTDFIRAMKTGRIDVVAEPINQGRTQQLWHVVITRAVDGKDVARGTVRLQNIPLP